MAHNFGGGSMGRGLGPLLIFVEVFLNDFLPAIFFFWGGGVYTLTHKDPSLVHGLDLPLHTVKFWYTPLL